MAVKRQEIDGVGHVQLYKRRGVRSVRLSISSDRIIRVTLPTWAPYQVGLDFVRTKRDWILKNMPSAVPTYSSGQHIGKAHRFVFTADPSARTIRTRIMTSEVHIIHPASQESSESSVQEAAQKAAVRALRQQAEQLLPQRLAKLAQHHDFTYNSVSIKQLKRRWGSCTNQKDIVLNLFLMQLPWELIDYVLIHELVHTKHLHHGKAFWDTFEACIPIVRELRKRIRPYQPMLLPQD